jgi:chromosome segregation ATPase
VIARGKKIALTQETAPIELISKFVELYDEKMFHEKELSEFEESKLKKALPKKEYKHRVKTAEERLIEINKALTELKNELKKAGSRYEELIKKIEKAEAEIEAAKASEAQINLQYRSGKISKEAYEAVINDVKKRIDKAKSIIESTLITLREEI